MTHVGGYANPMTQHQLRSAATLLRHVLKLNDQPYIDIEKMIEFTLPSVFSGFEYDYQDYEIMGDKHGEANPSEKILVLRKDVFERMRGGSQSDRMTAIHEVAHIFLHTPDRVKFPKQMTAVARINDPEWQADTFAAEFLAHHSIAKTCKDGRELAQRTGVPYDIGMMQFDSYVKEGIIISK